MKRFLAVLLCVLMVAAMFTITASADEGDGTVAVSIERVNVHRGDKNVKLTVSIVKNPGIAGLVLFFEMPEGVEFVKLSSVKGAEMVGWTLIQSAHSAVWAEAENYYYEGPILELTVNIKDDAKIGNLAFGLGSRSEATDYTTELDFVCSLSGGVTVCCDHVSDAGTVTKEASCTEKGIITYKCTKCDAVIDTKEIPMKDHTPDKGSVTKEATCTEDGVNTVKCSVCGKELSTSTIPAKGHKWGAPVTKEATCTEKGEITRTCSACGAFDKTEIPAKGHAPDKGTVSKEATCTEKGEMVIKCTTCGETLETKEIPAKEHTPDKGTVSKEATCTEKGEMLIKCSVCGETLETKEIPAKGHTPDKGTVSKEATCTEKGEMVIKCTTCGETETKEIPAKGHNWDEGDVTVAPTETTSGTIVYHCRECGETKTETLKPNTKPSTGDESALYIWATLFIMSGAAATASIIGKKAKSKR